MENNDYSAKDIVVLSGTQGVRKRPAMYIGSTGIAGFNHLLYEVIDNSIDEATAGFCNTIKITLYNEDGIDVGEVSDNGRGIPIDIIPKANKPALEVIMTSLHSGAKFENKIYKVSGGLHGVGLTVINSLSEYTVVTVKKNGKIYRQSFSRGIPTSELQVMGDIDPNDNGTTIKFKPDKEIFSVSHFDTTTITERLVDLSFLNPGLKIEFRDKRGITEDTEKIYHSNNGLPDFLDYIRSDKLPISKPIIMIKDYESIKVELAIQYVESYSEELISFVNRIKTGEGGTHVIGFHTALTRAITNYIQKNVKSKNKTAAIEGEDTREGLIGVISILMQNPEFEGQTKEKLGNSNIKSMVDSFVYSTLSTYFE